MHCCLVIRRISCAHQARLPTVEGGKHVADQVTRLHVHSPVAAPSQRKTRLISLR